MTRNTNRSADEAGEFDEFVISTPEEAAELAPGQWVWDIHGTPMCLVDTNVGAPQRMWMSHNGAVFEAIDLVDYPLHLAELDEDCPHPSGVTECGHCKRCGKVVAAPKGLIWTFSRIGVADQR